MMGTPCFLLEQAAPPFASGGAEFVPHKIQDSDASESGVMEGENTFFGSGRAAVAERSLRQLQPRQSSGEAQLEPLRQLERQLVRSVSPGLPITSPLLSG